MLDWQTVAGWVSSHRAFLFKHAGSFVEQTVAAGVGAATGAIAVFRLENSRQMRKEHGERVSRIREAIFALISQRNDLYSVDRQALSVWRDKPARHFAAFMGDAAFAQLVKLDQVISCWG